MASTRNKNTPSDYCLQQRSYRENMRYNLYEHSQYGTTAGRSAFPCVGTNMGHMPWEVLAKKPCRYRIRSLRYKLYKLS